MSSLFGLERRPEHGDPAPDDRAAADLAGEVDHPDPAAHVDRVDLAQEGQRLVGAQLAGPGHEGADVLGQAAAAEAEAGVEEPAADPGVVADRVGELRDVGAAGLADLGHRVDERDLGGQERVRRDLDQLGGRVVGDDQRGARRPAARRTPRRALRSPARRRPGGHAVDQPVRDAGCPRPRSPRAGTPGSRPASAPGSTSAISSASRAAVPTGTVDLPTTRSPGVRCGASAVDRRVDVRACRRRTRRASAGCRRRRSARRAAGVGDVRGERQPPGRPARLPAAPRSPGSKNGGSPAAEQLDLGRVDVDADHVVAELRHAGGVHGAEVAAADHGDAQRSP